MECLVNRVDWPTLKLQAYEQYQKMSWHFSNFKFNFFFLILENLLDVH